MIYQNLLFRGPYDISAQGTSLPFIYFICSEEHGGDVVVDDEQELYVNSIKLLVFGQRRQASLDVVADNEHGKFGRKIVKLQKKRRRSDTPRDTISTT